MSERIVMHSAVAGSLARSPIIGVVRTGSSQEASRQAHLFIAAGIELVEITFTVPKAIELVRQLVSEREQGGPPWIGMGTVTDGERAQSAAAAGASFLVSPNSSSEVAAVARQEGLFLVLGALSCTEIVEARTLGADLVKVYPLPPVGGAAYLATVRQPLDDIPMLAAGGFDIEEIPAYREAGAQAYGIGAPLLGRDDQQSHERIARALELARGESKA